MTRTGSDLSQQIEAILREATAKIVALLEGEQETMVESLQRAVAALDASVKSRTGLSEALLATAPAAGSTSASSRRPPRSQWIRTEDVVVKLRELLSDRPEGARIAELRDETGFSDMQLHRALRRLRDSGEVRKEGEMRRTVYRCVRHPRTQKAASTRSRRSTGARRPAPKAPPKGSGRVSTEEVKRAVRKTLRRRKRGLPMSRLRDATGYSDKQIHRAIVAMANEGLLERLGSGRNMRYVLIG